jgi:hypothetical protein
MGIDASGLWRDVSPDTELPAADLVNQLEGLEVELPRGAGQERVDMLDQWWKDELEPLGSGQVEQPTPEEFDPPCFGRQDVCNMLR